MFEVIAVRILMVRDINGDSFAAMGMNVGEQGTRKKS